MDINNQKVRENAPPSFRPAEVDGPGRRLVRLNRVFESAILRLCDGFTPLTQPTAWVERREEKERKKTEGGNQDGRRRPSLDSHRSPVTPAAIPLLCPN